MRRAARAGAACPRQRPAEAQMLLPQVDALEPPVLEEVSEGEVCGLAAWSCRFLRK